MDLNSTQTRFFTLASSGMFLVFAILYFCPADVPHKISFPLFAISVSSLLLTPWQMTMGLLLSALGDYMGSCGSFIGQMGFFAIAHVWYIAYFVIRYFKKVEHDRKLTSKAKGYLAMLIICLIGLLAVVFTRIVPCVPVGIIRTGVSVYAVLICLMLLAAMLQRSTLFALGALLFVFSDFILAWNRFVEPIPYHKYLIMVPYYLGQWLLFVRATSFRINSIRMFRF